jgi:Tol biopolymer transport system component
LPIRNRLLYSAITILVLLLVAAGYYLVKGNKLAPSNVSSNPLGSPIVFASNSVGDKSNNGARPYLLKSDGTYKDLVSSDGSKYRDAYNPTFSPDLSKIVYVTNVSSGMQLVEMNSDGSGKQQLSQLDGQKYSPSWSPDSSKILYSIIQLVKGKDNLVGEKSGLVQLTLADGKEMIIPANYQSVINPSWLPDGSGYVYLGSNDQQTYHLMLSKGGKDIEVRVLLKGVVVSDFVSDQVSPDGSKVLFTRNSDGQVYTVNLDGSGAKGLTNNKGGNFACASWSKDGSYVVAQHAAATKSVNDIAVVKVADGSVRTWNNSALTGINCPRVGRY